MESVTTEEMRRISSRMKSNYDDNMKSALSDFKLPNVLLSTANAQLLRGI